MFCRMIGLVVLAIIIVLYLLGIVGFWSIVGALAISVGSFMSLIFDQPRDKWKRAAFIALAILGIAMILIDAFLDDGHEQQDQVPNLIGSSNLPSQFLNNPANPHIQKHESYQ